LFGWGIFLFLLLSGCTTDRASRLEFFPSTSYSFPATQEELWETTLDTLKREYVSIAEANHVRGLVISKRFPIQSAEFRTWTKNSSLAPSGFGTLRLEVTSRGPGASRLEITVDFRAARRVGARHGGKHKASTGVFEDALSARIHAHVLAKKYPNLIRLAVGCDFIWDERANRYRAAEIDSGGLGEEQGFEENDLILRIDGEEVSIGNFFGALSNIQQNELKTFTVKRSDQTVDLMVSVFYLSPDLPWIGVRVERDPDTQVFRITDVAPSSPAGKAGLQPQDELLEEDGIEFTSWRNYYKAVTGANAGSDRTMTVNRSGKKLTLTVKPVPFESMLKQLRGENASG